MLETSYRLLVSSWPTPFCFVWPLYCVDVAPPDREWLNNDAADEKTDQSEVVSLPKEEQWASELDS